MRFGLVLPGGAQHAFVKMTGGMDSAEYDMRLGVVGYIADPVTPRLGASGFWPAWRTGSSPTATPQPLAQVLKSVGATQHPGRHARAALSSGLAAPVEGHLKWLAGSQAARL